MQDGVEALQVELEKLPAWDKSRILMIVDDDDELYHELMDAYCEDALTGLEEISIALASEKVDEVEHTAHALKGSSANVGGDRASEVCFWMERAAKDGSLSRCRTLYPILDREVTRFVTSVQQNDLKDIA